MTRGIQAPIKGRKSWGWTEDRMCVSGNPAKPTIRKKVKRGKTAREGWMHLFLIQISLPLPPEKEEQRRHERETTEWVNAKQGRQRGKKGREAEGSKWRSVLTRKILNWRWRGTEGDERKRRRKRRWGGSEYAKKEKRTENSLGRLRVHIPNPDRSAPSSWKERIMVKRQTKEERNAHEFRKEKKLIETSEENGEVNWLERYWTGGGRGRPANGREACWRQEVEKEVIYQS